MKKILALVIGFGALTLILAGCDSLVQSFHEGRSTEVILPVSIEKVAPAIKEAASKSGFIVTQTQSTPADGVYEGDSQEITYKKIDDKTTKIYARYNTAGNRDKEILFVNELKKELGIK